MFRTHFLSYKPRFAAFVLVDRLKRVISSPWLRMHLFRMINGNLLLRLQVLLRGLFALISGRKGLSKGRPDIPGWVCCRNPWCSDDLANQACSLTAQRFQKLKIGSCKASGFRYYIYSCLGPQDANEELGV